MISSQTPIIGGPHIDSTLLRVFLLAKAPRLEPKTREEIVCAYTAIGRLSGVGNLMPLAQAIHETGYFTSARWLQSFNPAGLGATDDGAWGGVFTSPVDGITAQIASDIGKR